jgi:RNA polymerase sigma factor (TIGR02999 family)
MDTIADLLQRARQGERGAFDTLFAQLYPTLRRLAHARLSGHQRPGMMGTTTLLHDSYLRLLGAGALPPADRAHFIAYAARVMRSVIVDAVRAAGRTRRGGDVEHLPLDEDCDVAAPLQDDEVLDIDRALGDLAALSPRLAQVVELRYFAGLTDAEIGGLLGVTERTVRRDWDKARLLLREALQA